MSDHVDVTGSSRKRPADVRLMSLPGALWRGLVTGVASLLLAAGIAALAFM
ncbi:hypothetical protein ABT297_22485 [Dactylosporangium sp. NPDC000555]|uniref:hypothetical protein n=1 Tax=Dactylosporangium sp. NPDC000555 TaxID=3154260 RepID=UPI00332E03A2